jgi:hypothetical protein
MKHTVQVRANCAPVSASSPDSQWSYVDERVTSTQPMKTWGLGGTGFGPTSSTCSFNPSTIDCPIPLNLAQASDAYDNQVLLTYPVPLQCAGTGTKVHITITLQDPNSGATETVQGDPDGPCAGSFTISGVPRKCVTGTFTIRQNVPATLIKLLDIATGGNNEFDGSLIDIFRLGAGGPRHVSPVFAWPAVGILKDGFTWKIFARHLKPGRYQVRLSDDTYAPTDYPNAFATFRRC